MNCMTNPPTANIGAVDEYAHKGIAGKASNAARMMARRRPMRSEIVPKNTPPRRYSPRRPGIDANDDLQLVGTRIGELQQRIGHNRFANADGALGRGLNHRRGVDRFATLGSIFADGCHGLGLQTKDGEPKAITIEVKTTFRSTEKLESFIDAGVQERSGIARGRGKMKSADQFRSTAPPRGSATLSTMFRPRRLSKRKALAADRNPMTVSRYNHYRVVGPY